MTYIDWFLQIAFVLQDDEPGHEFTRYKLANMVAAFNDAMTLAYRYRQDLFTSYRTVKLQPGIHQDVRGCCDSVAGVIDQVDENGNIIRIISGSRKTDTKNKGAWDKPSCLVPTTDLDGNPIDYIVEYAIIDPDLEGRFDVFPPVPCNGDYYLRVLCVRGPCPFDILNQNDEMGNYTELYTAVKHYVLAWMLTGDRFANAGGGDAQYHYRMFFDILRIQQVQNEKFTSANEVS